MTVEIKLHRISIHAPREGSDFGADLSGANYIISIHAPREGSDVRFPDKAEPHSKFQSTLPVRGATFFLMGKTHLMREFQSTLPVRGATSAGASFIQDRPKISIHAPREGSDCLRYAGRRRPGHFNPRSP